MSAWEENKKKKMFINTHTSERFVSRNLSWRHRCERVVLADVEWGSPAASRVILLENLFSPIHSRALCLPLFLLPRKTATRTHTRRHNFSSTFPPFFAGPPARLACVCRLEHKGDVYKPDFFFGERASEAWIRIWIRSSHKAIMNRRYWEQCK